MTYVGVRDCNPQNCPIRIFAARGSTVGLEIIGDGAGGAFNNQVHLGDIADCRYALQLDGRNTQPVKNNLTTHDIVQEAGGPAAQAVASSLVGSA